MQPESYTPEELEALWMEVVDFQSNQGFDNDGNPITYEL